MYIVQLQIYPGVENVLFFVPTTRSQVATNWHPAAALKPLTFAMIGTGDWIISSINSVHFSNTWRCSNCPLSMENSFKLWPAEKTEPVADKTMHRRFSSCLLRRKFVSNSDIISNDKAFLRSKFFVEKFVLMALPARLQFSNQNVWMNLTSWFTYFLDYLIQYYELHSVHWQVSI